MVISSPCLTDIKNWLVQKQTAFGKDFSNPFTADSLLKTIWFSTHHASHAPCYSNEALAIPEQTATGKEISNPFMAGEDCWVLEDFTTYCCWFNIGAASEDLVLLRKYLDIVKAQGLEMHEADPNCTLNVMLYHRSKSKFYVRFYRALSIALYVIGFHVKPTTNGFCTGEIENHKSKNSS
ncbi:hypothetical protein Tco_0505077 [Tanacetum coccineum]